MSHNQTRPLSWGQESPKGEVYVSIYRVTFYYSNGNYLLVVRRSNPTLSLLIWKLNYLYILRLYISVSVFRLSVTLTSKNGFRFRLSVNFQKSKYFGFGFRSTSKNRNISVSAFGRFWKIENFQFLPFGCIGFNIKYKDEY